MTIPATLPDCVPLSTPPATDAPTEGPLVCRWIEANCRYGEGDRHGQPVRLERFQRHFLYHLYELNPDGSRRYRRALLETPKGNGKTPLAGWVGLYELCGPGRTSPVIPVAASSYDQSDLVFNDMRVSVTASPDLAANLDVFEGEIQVKGGPGRAYKVAAIAGTNDGARPSCFLADEVHEWLGNRARVHLVLSNGCAKRAGSLVFNTTTPGNDPDTLAGRLHDYGTKVNTGEVVDPAFLFVWYSAADVYDLDDPAELRAAIRAANPAADRFLNVEDVAARFAQVPRFEFERYHLGRWTSVGEAWLPAGAWAACASEGAIPEGATVTLGFDGSFNNDSTALVVCAIDDVPRLDVVAAWERPADVRHDWQVPVVDVEEAIRAACRRWQVREIACDPFRWARTYQILEGEGLPIVEYPQSPARMVPATQRFYEAVTNRTVTHSGDPRLARHLDNCVIKVDGRGARLAKEHRNSSRKIDLAVAAVMAYDRACQSVDVEPAPEPFLFIT